MGKVAVRRARMIDAIIDASVEVMAELGAAGLTLGEVARRMNMRTPSLYEYVRSRADLCDLIFARGWRELNERTRQIGHDPTAEPHEVLLEGLTTLVTWALDHPGYAQLMFWRPIPGWHPAPDAFAPAIESMQQATDVIAGFQRRGLLDDRLPAPEIAQQYAVLGAGIISQQLSNEPGVAVAEGRASRHVADLARMFTDHHRPGTVRDPKPGRPT